jgi:hypothetical protein
MDTSPSSDDVAPPPAQVHRISRGPGPLDSRGDRVACGGTLSTPLGFHLCKSRLRLFPFNTVRRVVAPAAAALRLFPRGLALTREVRAPTHAAQGRMSAVTLRLAETLTVLALQRALWRHFRFHRHSQTAELDKESHHRHLWLSRHGYNEVGGR